MKTLYKNNSRNQFIACDLIDKETKEKFRKRFDEVVKSREIGWEKWFDINIFNIPDKKDRIIIQEEFTLRLRHDVFAEKTILSCILQTSLDLIKTAIDRTIPTPSRVFIEYVEMNLDEDFETDYDKQHYYSFNYYKKEMDEEKETYGCIFCLERGCDVKDGQLVFYPYFSEEFVSCCNYPGSIDLPEFKEGEVYVLSGSTYHNFPKITGKGNMKLLYVIFP